jgi:hypothetical protein
MVKDFFTNRVIAIATMHEKEKVIAPLLYTELGLQSIVPANLDTDQFGTFSGEIERTRGAIETARLKCFKAMEISGCEIAIANEGSFGSHPQIGFVHADSELVVLIDRKNNLEFSTQEISCGTNFNGTELMDYAHLVEFANTALFPSHGLILRKAKEEKVGVVKGIGSWHTLQETYWNIFRLYGQVYVETDMRAMYNPTRMKVIEMAVSKLINIVKNPCPICSMPGFTIVNALPGLPCSQCQRPTRSTLKYIYACKSCAFSREALYPHKKRQEDPTYCDFCNP